MGWFSEPAERGTEILRRAEEGRHSTCRSRGGSLPGHRELLVLLGACWQFLEAHERVRPGPGNLHTSAGPGWKSTGSGEMAP
jgi:hypothetical protein